MSDSNQEPTEPLEEETSWSRDLVEGYRQAILDFQCQIILLELEKIDGYVEFMEPEGFPHAEEIIKRILYNVKREERKDGKQ